MSYNCDICDVKITHSQNILKHKRTEKCQYIKRLLDKKNTVILDRNKIIQKENEELKEKIKMLLEENKEKDNKIKNIEDKAEEYRKIIEKVASKTTTTTNVVNNKNTYNNHLNYISSEPINYNTLKDDLSKVITAKSMLYDDEAFNNHIINNILRDENGKDKVLCTDINRKNFSYKDQTSGKLVSDPELENLREKLKKGVDFKIIRQELLDIVINKYKDDPNIEPYEKLFFLMNKLEFGDPFVVQVAKKTYIKSKTPLSIENL